MSEDPRKLLLDAAALIMQACPMANIRFAEHGGWFAGCDGEGRNYTPLAIQSYGRYWHPFGFWSR